MPAPRTPTVDPNVQFCTIRKACALTGAPEQLVREAIDEGRLPVYLGDGSWRRVCVGEVADLVRKTRRVESHS
jgi:hypothetical protein